MREATKTIFQWYDHEEKTEPLTEGQMTVKGRSRLENGDWKRKKGRKRKRKRERKRKKRRRKRERESKRKKRRKRKRRRQTGKRRLKKRKIKGGRVGGGKLRGWGGKSEMLERDEGKEGKSRG